MSPARRIGTAEPSQPVIAPESDESDLRVGYASEGKVLLAIRGLTKVYPLQRRWPRAVLHPLQEEQVSVVHEVSMDVLAGECIGFLGPTGAGKTTLLRMLAGDIDPDGGSAVVAGHDLVRHRKEVQRLVEPAPKEEKALDPELTARRTLEVHAGRLRRERGERGEGFTPRSTDEILRVTGLHDAADQPVGSFSPLMKQRLLIGRALLSRPAVLIMNEPTESFDPVSAADFRTFLRDDLVKREKCTILLSTRDPEEAFSLCDRVAVMNRGKVLAVRPPKEFLEAVGGEWYRVWIRQAGLDSLMTLTGHREIRGFRSHAASTAGWTRVEVEIPGGLEAAARVLGSLTKSGIQIARFERVGLTLTQLLEQLDTSGPAMVEAGSGKEEDPGVNGAGRKPPILP